MHGTRNGAGFRDAALSPIDLEDEESDLSQPSSLRSSLVIEELYSDDDDINIPGATSTLPDAVISRQETETTISKLLLWANSAAEEINTNKGKCTTSGGTRRGRVRILEHSDEDICDYDAFTFGVRVKRYHGRIMTVSVTHLTTVAQLKTQICRGRQATEENILYNGQALQDDHTLAFYNITTDSTLYLQRKDKTY